MEIMQKQTLNSKMFLCSLLGQNAWSYLTITHRAEFSVLLKSTLARLGIRPPLLSHLPCWLCFNSFSSQEAREGHIETEPVVHYFYFLQIEYKNCWHLFYSQMISQSGQDYTQSNPELRRKQGQSSVWSSHHLCACPGYWAVLCFTPWINPTWGLNDAYKHWILNKAEGHMSFFTVSQDGQLKTV